MHFSKTHAKWFNFLYSFGAVIPSDIWVNQLTTKQTKTANKVAELGSAT